MTLDYAILYYIALHSNTLHYNSNTLHYTTL